MRHRTPSWFVAALAVLAGLLIAPASVAADEADPLPAAGSLWSPAAKAKSGHAWIAAPWGMGFDQRPVLELFHAAPRADPVLSGPGLLKPVLRLALLPEALAAWEDEVFLAYAPSPRDEKPIRRVGRLVAVQGSAGTWGVEPETGPQSLPALPAEGDLVGFCGSPFGLTALIRRPASLHCYVLVNSGWSELLLPPEIADAAPLWATLIASPEAFGLLWTNAANSGVAWGRIIQSPISQGGQGPDDIAAAWRLRTLPNLARPLPGERVADSRPNQRWAAWVDGQIILAERRDDRPLVLRSVREGGSFELARIPQPEGPLAIAPLDGAGRLLIASAPPLPPPGDPAAAAPVLRPGTLPKPPPQMQMTEVSVYSGEVGFSGPGRPEQLVGENQWRVFVVGLVAVMAAVLIFVLRSESDVTPVLPEGLALAPPATRFTAAAIDLSLAMVLGCWAQGVSVTSVFSWALLTDPAGAWAPIATGLVLVWIYGTLAEWRTGRTLGKWLLGCGVLGVQRKPPSSSVGPDAEQIESGPLSNWAARVRVGQVIVGRPTFTQAAIRNAIRWGLAPVAVALTLIDANWRHLGDVLAGTTVAEPIAPDEPEDSEDPWSQ